VAIYNLAWGVIILPLLGGLASFLAETQRRAALLCTAFSGVAFVMAAVVLIARLSHAPDAPFNGFLTLFAMSPPESSIFASRLEPQLGVHVDALSASFAAAIAFVSLVLMWYALTSLRGEATYRRFFWAASLLASVTAAFVYSPNLFDSLFMLMIGSAAIYILVSHWWQRPDAAAPARRVMVLLSVADVTLLLAVAFTFLKFGVFAGLLRVPTGQTLTDPFAFTTLSQGATAVLHGVVAGAGPRTVVILGILVFFAAMVRAGQVPFHVWLTEATTAPLPVIAMCATLGAVPGVLLIAQMYAIVAQAPHLPTAIAFVGAATAAAAAITSVAQRDLLRIGVFAAIAQLGLVLVALGVGGYSQAMFIAFTSLFLMTLFLLAAGNVVRVYRTRNLHEMGGAWRRMRLTSVALSVWAAGLGGLALSTYYVLSATFNNTIPGGGHVAGWAIAILAAMLIVTALFIALFAFRVVIHVCGGEVAKRRGFQSERVREVERPLRRPLLLVLVAAVGSVIAGLPGIQPIHSGKLSVPGLTFIHFVFFGAQRPYIPVDGLALLLSMAVLAVGAGAAFVLWAPDRRVRTAALSQRFEPVMRALARGLFVERTGHRAGQPVLAAAQRTSSFDLVVIDALTDAAAGGVDLAAAGVWRVRTPRVNVYLAGAMAVVAVLALLAVLAATGHFWIHTV
jgi:NADH-quinone oxidoreductase subunit L